MFAPNFTERHLSKKVKKDPTDTSLQEDLSIDATFTPCHCTYCTSIILLCTYRTYCTYYKIICPVCCNLLQNPIDMIVKYPNRSKSNLQILKSFFLINNYYVQYLNLQNFALRFLSSCVCRCLWGPPRATLPTVSCSAETDKSARASVPLISVGYSGVYDLVLQYRTSGVLYTDIG
jgi:hypothetical protein